MGIARRAKAQLRRMRLAPRIFVCTALAVLVLGGGTAGALVSIGGGASPRPNARGSAHASSWLPDQVDPGGLIEVRPDPLPPPQPPVPPSPVVPALPNGPPAPPPPPVGAAALAEISYPWQQLHYQIVFLGSRPDLMGQTFFDEHRIEIYLRTGESRATVAHVIAHEIGHAIDVAYNTSERRQQWLNLRGASTSEPWFGCNGCDDFSSPAGDYAETFSFWQLGASADYSHLAPPPSPAQLRQLIPLFYASGAGAQDGSSAQAQPPSSSNGSSPPPSSGPPGGGGSCLTIVCTSNG